MTSSNPKGRNKHYLSYECHQKNCPKHERLGVDQAHEQFTAILSSLRPSKRVLRLFNELVFMEWDESITSLKQEAHQKERQIERLESELTNIANSNTKGILNDEEAIQRAEKVRSEILVLKVEKSEIKIDEYDTEAVKTFTETFLINIDRFWKELDLTQKQVLQSQIFPDGVICDKKIIRTTHLSPSFELIMALKDENSDYVRCYNEVRTYFQAL